MACTSPPEVANGYVSYESLATGPSWPDTTEVVYKCFKYYGLVGSDRLTCSSGTWTGTAPQCEWHSDTEIVFWFLIALVTIMVLLLIILLIFVCCYFCKCCGSGKRNKGRFEDDWK